LRGGLHDPWQPRGIVNAGGRRAELTGKGLDCLQEAKVSIESGVEARLEERALEEIQRAGFDRVKRGYVVAAVDR